MQLSVAHETTLNLKMINNYTFVHPNPLIDGHVSAAFSQSKEPPVPLGTFKETTRPCLVEEKKTLFVFGHNKHAVFTRTPWKCARFGPRVGLEPMTPSPEPAPGPVLKVHLGSSHPDVGRFHFTDIDHFPIDLSFEGSPTRSCDRL